MANKNYSLAHTKWMCKYTIVVIQQVLRNIVSLNLLEDNIICAYEDV